jgi:hypothetical protein
MNIKYPRPLIPRNFSDLVPAIPGDASVSHSLRDRTCFDRMLARHGARRAAAQGADRCNPRAARMKLAPPCCSLSFYR